jgi:hypothetical protein
MSDLPPGTPEPREASSPAEARLQELLELVRAVPPRPPARLTADVVHAARFERRVRAAAVSAGHLGAAALEGLVVLLGLRGHRK